MLIAIVAQGGGVLYRQDMPPLDQSGSARTSGRDHLFRPHAPIAQETRKAHLASPIAPHATHADTSLPNRDEAGQKIDPPFSRRRSPNRPKPHSIS